MLTSTRANKMAGAVGTHRRQQGAKEYRTIALNGSKKAQGGPWRKPDMAPRPARRLALRRWGRAVPAGLVARSLLERIQPLSAWCGSLAEWPERQAVENTTQGKHTMNHNPENQKEARERLAATHGRENGVESTIARPVAPSKPQPAPLSKPADGGPAFPQFAAWSTAGGLNCGTIAEGLSARTYCAVHVLSGMLANPEFMPRHTPGETSEAAYARRAVDYTEALLARLNTASGPEGQADPGAGAVAVGANLPPADEVLRALHRLVDLVERGHRHFAFEDTANCEVCRAGAAALDVLAKAKAQGRAAEEGGAQ